jgi:hypothetical protein
MRRHTQLDRYRLGVEVASAQIGEVEFFPLKENESPQVARARIFALLTMGWRHTTYFAWSLRAKKDGVLVKKVGRLRGPFSNLQRPRALPRPGVRARI